jgi:hypothetical protein
MPPFMEVVISLKFIDLSKELCIHVANNINYFAFDYEMHYSTFAKGFTFWCVVVGRPRWSNVEGSSV